MEGELIYSLSKADNTASCLGYFLSGQSFLSVLHSHPASSARFTLWTILYQCSLSGLPFHLGLRVP